MLAFQPADNKCFPEKGIIVTVKSGSDVLIQVFAAIFTTILNFQ
jgi:hypothetical protein